KYLVAVRVNEDYLGPVRAIVREEAAYDSDGNASFPSTSHDNLVIFRRANLPPVVLDESIVVDYGETIVIDVLANDHDPDGDAMTLVSANAYGGEAAITAEGMISFTAPPEGSAGPGAIIFYLVSDGSCEESEGTVHVDYASDGD
ncbi:cadherin-like domain-containing protein, partial [Candidatus Bipolaricaulota bacterium]|nr:cadherin-like domain-containing protein [Candidatus Bipolaricaulota bacterium]